MTNTNRRILTAAEMSTKLAAGAALRNRTAELRVQIAAELGDPQAAYSRSVRAEANRRAKAGL